MMAHADNLDVPVIAIDGPSGVGKGTVAKVLARLLGWNVLDSGALYRIVALYTLSCGRNDVAGFVKSVLELEDEGVEVAPGPIYKLLDFDVTERIRKPDVSGRVYHVSKVPEVRRVVGKMQLLARQPPGLIADGRDMAFVFDGSYKYYLDAPPEVRAQRRYEEEAKKPENRLTPQDVAEALARRDHEDRTRTESPLVQHPEALYVDTTMGGAEHVARHILEDFTRRVRVA